MSDSTHLAHGVDTTLLKIHFAMVTDAVGELRFLVKSNKFPPTVNIVRSLSSFSGFTSQNILPYVTFFVFGDLIFWIECDCICPLYPSVTLS